MSFTFVTNATETTLDGRPYLVAPVAMARETPHKIHAYELSEELLAAFPNGYNQLMPLESWDMDSWDGKPIVANVHPRENGQYVSARSPRMIEKYGIGTVYGVHTQGEFLSGIGWFDVRKTNRIAPEIVKALRSGLPLGCSVGVAHNGRTQTSWTEGVHKGVAYHLLCEKLWADHLTVFSGDNGRCNQKDGCGINVPQPQESSTGKSTHGLYRYANA